MAYWIFQADPKRYKLEDSLADLNEKLWEVNQHQREIHAGDYVLVWKAGKDAGVYAVAETLTEPAVVPADDDPHWAASERARAAQPKPRVKIRILHNLLNGPLLRSAMMTDPKLKSLSILKFAQGTNFPVTDEEWVRIMQLCDLDTADEERQDTTTSSLDVAEVHLRQALARDLGQVETGLTPFFEEKVEEYPVPGGRIDLLCKDSNGNPVVVELKRHHGDLDKAVGQVSRYMGWAKRTLAEGGAVRGILLIPDENKPDTRLDDAVAAVPGLEVKRYLTSFRVVS